VDVVLVGLPGSGKSAVGRRLAAELGAAFLDLDQQIEQASGSSVARLFEQEGEAGFRVRERAAVAALGPSTPESRIRRVVAAGGGAIVDPRNRWQLYRGRVAFWLDAPNAVLAARLADPAAAERPLLAGDDPIASLERLRAARLPFYAAARRIEAAEDPAVVAGRVADTLRDRPPEPGAGAVLLRRDEPPGNLILGERMAASGIHEELRTGGAHRALLLSEPGAWAAAAGSITARLAELGWAVERVLLPSGEAAKRLSVVEAAAGELARLGLEREEPLVAIGGGALTDTAGFIAATYARGVPWLAVPTTLVGQIDAALGGKTAVDLAAGKNLVGAFHLPRAVVVDVATLASLPERERRAALGEAVKVGLLGEDRVLEILEAEGPGLAAGDPAATETGALAEVVERCARLKLDIVARDPEEHGERIALNLGHSLGHAIEAATDFRDVRHGAAVAYGLRAACRIGLERATLGPERVARVERLLDALDLATAPLSCPASAVLAILGADKKRRSGRLRWVLPTDTGWTIDEAVPDDVVASVTASVLAGRSVRRGGRAPVLEVPR
jgi:3-dehydroquinate synthetase/shikimate kinase